MMYRYFDEYARAEAASRSFWRGVHIGLAFSVIIVAVLVVAYLEAV